MERLQEDDGYPCEGLVFKAFDLRRKALLSAFRAHERAQGVLNLASGAIRLLQIPGSKHTWHHASASNDNGEARHGQS